MDLVLFLQPKHGHSTVLNHPLLLVILIVDFQGSRPGHRHNQSLRPSRH